MTRAAGYSRPVPRDAVRILTTNDFVALFFPQATSYGGLPGAAALQATVDELRDAAGGGFWVDTGDLAQGSALGTISDGAWPFLALRERCGTNTTGSRSPRPCATA